MPDEVQNPVAEFQVVLLVKFSNGKDKAYRSPKYTMKMPGIGPELLVHVMQSRLAEWVKAIFDE